jgi:hypothetical protein
MVQLAHRILLASSAPITGDYWCPVLSGRVQNVRLGHPMAPQIPIIRLMIGAPDSKIETLSVLYTYCSSPDSKLESGEEQGLSKLEPVLLSEIKTLKFTGIKGTVSRDIRPSVFFIK